jgi:hypothetical protein
MDAMDVLAAVRRAGGTAAAWAGRSCAASPRWMGATLSVCRSARLGGLAVEVIRPPLALSST